LTPIADRTDIPAKSTSNPIDIGAEPGRARRARRLRRRLAWHREGSLLDPLREGAVAAQSSRGKAGRTAVEAFEERICERSARSAVEGAALTRYLTTEGAFCAAVDAWLATHDQPYEGEAAAFFWLREAGEEP
jgi:hypothetical protein